jgi:hypothetical protein
MDFEMDDDKTIWVDIIEGVDFEIQLGEDARLAV